MLELYYDLLWPTLCRFIFYGTLALIGAYELVTLYLTDRFYAPRVIASVVGFLIISLFIGDITPSFMSPLPLMYIAALLATLTALQGLLLYLRDQYRLVVRGVTESYGLLYKYRKQAFFGKTLCSTGLVIGACALGWHFFLKTIWDGSEHVVMETQYEYTCFLKGERDPSNWECVYHRQDQG